jgi:hypothetical protein
VSGTENRKTPVRAKKKNAEEMLRLVICACCRVFVRVLCVCVQALLLAIYLAVPCEDGEPRLEG